MPRIPLYNKGLGSTGVTSGGSLGPRASAGAFTGVGQQLAKFGESAGQIMFDFYDADKKEEAKTSISQAENDLTLALDKYIDEDTTTSIKDFDDKYKVFAKEKINKISSKYKLRPNEQKFMLAKLSDLSVGVQQKGRRVAAQKQDVLRGNVANDTLTNNISIMSSLTKDNPVYLKKQKENEELLSTAVGNGTLGFLKYKTSSQIDKIIEQKTFDSSLLNATSLSEIDKIENDFLKTKQPSSVKLKASSAATNRRNKFMSDILESAEGQYRGDFNYEQLLLAKENLKNKKSFTITSETGDTLSFDAEDYNETLISKLLKINNDILQETEAEITSVNVSKLTDSTDSKDLSKTDVTIGNIYQEIPDKGLVDDILITSAKGVVTQAKVFLEQGNFNLAKKKADAASKMIEQEYGGRPNLIDRVGSIGNSANKVKLSIANIYGDIEEKKQYQAKINTGIKAFNHGDLDYYYGMYSEKEISDITEKGIANKPLPQQIKDINDNNVVYKPFKSILIGGYREGLSDSTSKQAQQGYELYSQIKAIAPGSLDKHLDEDATAFYESINVLTDVGINIPDAINQIQKQMTSGININAKYRRIKDSVDQILDSQKTSFLGFTFSGGDVKNRLYIHQKVKDLTEIYIGMGTMDEETAFGKAIDQINRSHINLAGELLPKRKNFPFYPKDETLVRSVNLAIEDFKKRNPEYADEDDIRLIPVPNRVDTWNILVGSVIASYAKNPSYTDEDLKKFIEGDKLTKLNNLVQKNLQNRGLTEPQQLLSEAQKLRREANKLTGSYLAKLRKEQGEVAVKSAIAKRDLLLQEADNINKLLNEQQRLESGS